ncbi:MAG: hypothetical protein IKK39_16485 [Thermoguttaceae bacterium]|nr:hypothetical protein [Thermoguttaceae bacterium]
MKKNANLANARNRRRRNALTWPLAALLGAALFVLPTDAAKADDFGFSLNLGCFSLNIGNNDDCCAHYPPVVVAPPKPAPRPIVVAPAPAPRPIVVAPPKPAPRPIVVAPPKPAPRPVVVLPPKPAPRPGKAPAVVRGQAPNRDRNARATYSPVKNARAPRR